MATLQQLQKSIAIVAVISPVDINGGAVTGDYIHMKNYDGVCYVCEAGALAANLVITVNQCTQDADGGTDAKAMTNAKATTFTNGTDEDTVRVIQIDVAQDMDVDGGFEWLRVQTNAAASPTLGSVTALCYRARWAEATMPSAIT